MTNTRTLFIIDNEGGDILHDIKFEYWQRNEVYFKALDWCNEKGYKFVKVEYKKDLVIDTNLTARNPYTYEEFVDTIYVTPID